MPIDSVIIFIYIYINTRFINNKRNDSEEKKNNNIRLNLILRTTHFIQQTNTIFSAITFLFIFVPFHFSFAASVQFFIIRMRKYSSVLRVEHIYTHRLVFFFFFLYNANCFNPVNRKREKYHGPF